MTVTVTRLWYSALLFWAAAAFLLQAEDQYLVPHPTARAILATIFWVLISGWFSLAAICHLVLWILAIIYGESRDGAGPRD